LMSWAMPSPMVTFFNGHGRSNGISHVRPSPLGSKLRDSLPPDQTRELRCLYLCQLFFPFCLT
jgi:hypothetical protein